MSAKCSPAVLPFDLRSAWDDWVRNLLAENRMPLSGDVKQWIKARGEVVGQVELFNDNIENSSDPATERAIVSKHSYGRQLGRILDVLEPLVRANASLINEGDLMTGCARAPDSFLKEVALVVEKKHSSATVCPLHSLGILWKIERLRFVSAVYGTPQGGTSDAMDAGRSCIAPRLSWHEFSQCEPTMGERLIEPITHPEDVQIRSRSAVPGTWGHKVFLMRKLLECGIFFAFVYGGTVMAQQKTPEEQIKELQAQVSLLQQQATLLTQQTSLIGAQTANQAAQQTIQAVTDKAIADKMKELVESEFNLEKARAKGPFAELLGIKEALGSLQVSGKEGAIAIAKGTEGALIFRVKKEMLMALDEISADVVAALPASTDPIVVASKSDIEAAYKSQFLLKRIVMQKDYLQKALEDTGPKEHVESLAAGLAAVQGVGVTLGALGDLGKFFRVDRNLAVFDAGEEAQELFELLVERRAKAANKNVVIRVDEPAEDLLTEADSLIMLLESLLAQQNLASERQAKLQEQIENASKLPADKPKPWLPSAEAMARLKGEIEGAKLLVEGLNPGKAGDAFWSQVLGQTKYKRIGAKNRLVVSVKAQTVQVLEKRTWRADRLLGSGEVQVSYRLTRPNGDLLSSGVVFRASETRDAFQASGGPEILKLPYERP